MTIAIRTEILKAAFEDPETKKKLLNPDISWNEMQKIIKEFAEKKGWKVVQL
jgi:hypothetical protein